MYSTISSCLLCYHYQVSGNTRTNGDEYGQLQLAAYRTSSKTLFNTRNYTAPALQFGMMTRSSHETIQVRTCKSITLVQQCVLTVTQAVVYSQVSVLLVLIAYVHSVSATPHNKHQHTNEANTVTCFGVSCYTLLFCRKMMVYWYM
jgi:hypothetical protein